MPKHALLDRPKRERLGWARGKTSADGELRPISALGMSGARCLRWKKIARRGHWTLRIGASMCFRVNEA